MKYLSFSFPGLPGIGCAFSLGQPAGNLSFAVSQDDAAVRRNRLSLKAELGFSTWHSLRQVHGTRMLFEPESDTLNEPSREEADGLATSKPGQALAIKTADCQPLLLAHASGGFVAALHVGWRGNAAGFIQSGVKDFCARYGLKPSELLAVRGPSLGPGASHFTDFASAFAPELAVYFDKERGLMDLWRLTRAQLEQAGLAPGNIYGLDLCTFSLPEFFSYRRDKNCGRQISLIWIKNKD